MQLEQGLLLSHFLFRPWQKTQARTRVLPEDAPEDMPTLRVQTLNGQATIEAYELERMWEKKVC